ncbi:inner membrane protein YiaA [Pantoea sp. EA-12]|uniref:inner membrane protein YiaA n=1 Tax=Pantoea sp. EA-12 TaxID=3043303 RepID=UPI0024B5B6DB|nr:inner membrane protein YiaA [Pantoea sp. EA-12]MDI9219594.1 inner membrane protein YiaA [Pantoea sp. EA-12]
MKTQNIPVSPAFIAISWIAMLGGTLVYMAGLWRAEMQLNEKGYYFAVLILGLFAAVSLQKTVRDRLEGIPTTHLYHMVCLLAFTIAVVLLVIGLWNATLQSSEKGFYGVSFFMALFGAVAVQKNTRDGMHGVTDSNATEYQEPQP